MVSSSDQSTSGRTNEGWETAEVAVVVVCGVEVDKEDSDEAIEVEEDDDEEAVKLVEVDANTV